VEEAAVSGRALLALVLLVAAAACAGIRAQTDSFNTLEDARRAGAMERGLLPLRLPPGARDIRIAYVPGTSDRWGLFNFPPDQGGTLRAELGPDEVALPGLHIDVPPRFEWWPVALRGDLDAEGLTVTGLRAYQTRDGRLLVAVHWAQGRAYYWRAP
jgi:hypothetical protein